MADLVPVAQYLRMSTEHQQYSLENQSATIQKYADAQGFQIVRTYSDATKSGLVLKRRSGLRQLLQDVVAFRASGYKGVLVYDVSRWGRFQDADESAHYEFLCKSVGVPVHYCAETFANDGSLPSMMMKAMKRIMAGDFSRELGVKVLEGQKNLARLGFKQGGVPGYGLRRLLVAADGSGKQLLADGERKSIATDRVILVPGPAHEVQVVRDIYKMLVDDELSVHGIAGELNRRGVDYIHNSHWNYQAVYGILSHPKYSGCHVFNRTSSRLYTPTVKVPRKDWILTPEAFQPIVECATFDKAQQILQGRTINKSDEDVLECLKRLLALKGRLSLKLIKESGDTPSPSTYRHRFGSLRRAYELIGYGRPEHFGPIDLRRRTRAMRDELMTHIVSMFSPDVSIMQRGGRYRNRLLVRGDTVSVLLARAVRIWKTTIRWKIDPNPREQKYVTLLARLDATNTAFMDFHIFRKVDRRKPFYIKLNDLWLSSGVGLNDLSDFHSTCVSLNAQCRPRELVRKGRR